VVTDQSDPNGYTLNTNFIIPQYQIAAQYVVWETGVGLVDKTFSQIITFTRASTATYFDSAGVLQSAAVDAPRLDYNPSTLAAQGLLIEESRQNLCLQSEAFNTLANWSTNNSSITANAVNSPAATLTADQITEDSATAFHSVSQSGISYTSGTAYTFSVFAKANSRSIVQIAPGTGAFSAGPYANFNLSTGAVSATGGGASATIQNCGNGWYRCTMTATADATVSAFIFFVMQTSGTATRLQTYLGDGASNLYLWGAQVEAGAFSTSYIPTTTTALTRSADVASVNTLSPWYNASASTLYTEFTTPVPTSVNNSAVVVGFDDGTANNRFSNFYVSNTGAVSAIQTIAGVQSFTITGASGLTLSNIQKGAASYQAGSYAMSVNGAPPVADAFASAPPTVNTMRIGLRPSGTQANMYLRRIVYYPRRLTDLELRQITLPTGATITTQDYSFDSNFTGNTVAIGS
jgi:hypothetical protein